jgi:predicted TPR repeat methyltransferase
VQIESHQAAPCSAPTVKHNPAYVGPRSDIADLVSPASRLILDIGCSTGVLGRQLKERQQCEVHGVDFSKTMLEEAARYLDSVHCFDLNRDASPLATLTQRFDTVIAADLLEHLADPWNIVNICHSLLSKGGTLIVSIPNVSHYSTLLALLSLKWPDRDRGIHDRTHLRFFSKRNIETLLDPKKFDVVEIRRNLRLIERPSRLNRISIITNVPFIREYFTFQYLIKAIAK